MKEISKGEEFFKKLSKSEQNAIFGIMKIEGQERRLKLKSGANEILKNELKEIISTFARSWENDN